MPHQDDRRTIGQESTERAREMSSQAQQKAAEYGERTRQQVESGKEQAAEGMEQTAGKLRERTQGQDGMQAKVGERAAEGMEKTASYLREHDTNEMVDDVERYVKEHPGQAVLGAVVAGFVIGRILR